MAPSYISRRESSFSTQIRKNTRASGRDRSERNHHMVFRLFFLVNASKMPSVFVFMPMDKQYGVNDHMLHLSTGEYINKRLVRIFPRNVMPAASEWDKGVLDDALLQRLQQHGVVASNGKVEEDPR